MKRPVGALAPALPALIACLFLGACVTDETASVAPAGSAAASALASTNQPEPQAPAARAVTAAATHTAASNQPPVPAPEPQEPMTPVKAREECWMRAEGNKDKALDARLKFVEKCVDEKLNGTAR